jgi:hypothetical protein
MFTRAQPFCNPISGTVLYNGSKLLAVRKLIREGDLVHECDLGQRLFCSAKKVQEQADWVYTQQQNQPIHTPVNKVSMPPSGDKHDYMSIIQYAYACTDSCDPATDCSFWNFGYGHIRIDMTVLGCDTATGLPWYIHDGYFNPAANDEANSDHSALKGLMSKVYDLSLSNFFLGNAEHGALASKLLYAWFVDKETLMNPNMKYANTIPGRSPASPAIIQMTTYGAKFFESIRLLEFTGALDPAFSATFRAWVMEWVRWATDSSAPLLEWPHGDYISDNNHGMYYDVFMVAAATYAQDSALATQICKDAVASRLEIQLGADGTLPHEDLRSDGERYHLFTSTAIMELARLCGVHGVNLYTPLADGRSIQQTIDFVVPVLTGAKRWPYDQKEGHVTNPVGFIFRMANAVQEQSWQAKADAYQQIATSPEALKDGALAGLDLVLPL